MRRVRRSSTLRRRYGRSHYGLPVGQRHAYSNTLTVLHNNPAATRDQLRHWMQQEGVHKAVTNRVLSIAEQRGHVYVRGGRYSLTGRGIEALHPEIRGDR